MLQVLLGGIDSPVQVKKTSAVNCMKSLDDNGDGGGVVCCFQPVPQRLVQSGS